MTTVCENIDENILTEPIIASQPIILIKEYQSLTHNASIF